jgi:CheY-like chemotaxis protein
MKRNVLVVDDSEGNRRLVRRMLQQLGCRVAEVADGEYKYKYKYKIYL